MENRMTDTVPVRKMCHCTHPMDDHNETGCYVVVAEGYCEPGDDTRDFPDVFCACPVRGAMDEDDDE